MDSSIPDTYSVNELKVPLSSQYFTEGADSIAIDVKSFLSKPMEIQTGNFDTTDVSTTFNALYMPRFLIGKDMYFKKLSGYMGFRATMCFKLQVNAQRFQQGRYMLCVIPTAGYPYGTKVDGWQNMHAATYVQRSLLPHVEIDLNTQTSCEIKVPYSSAFDFYDMQNASSGTYPVTHVVRVFPYSPVNSASSTVCKYTLWAWLEDVELIGQALPVEFQSGLEPARKEAKKANVGPVESAALAVRDASTILGRVPLLSSYVTPLGWVAESVAGVAKVFGWSAPKSVQPSELVRHSTWSYATNSDKFDRSYPLALSQSNSVAVHPSISESGVDELDFVSLCSRYAYCATTTWSTSDAENDLIESYNVGLEPKGLIATTYGSGTTVSGYHYAPCQWIGSFFAFWRGSVVFKLKFVKTEFHSGRLSIEFNPTASAYTSGPLTDDVAPYLYRDIIDIRGLVEYEFEVPFIHNVPYLPTNSGLCNYGYLEVRVIDPLVAPSTVSSSVKIITEFRLSDDAEFAVVDKKLSVVVDDSTIVLQSGVPTLGGMKRRSAQMDSSATCMGEKITNLRSLLKRFDTAPRASATKELTAGRTYEVLPFGNLGVEVSGINRSINRYSDLYGLTMTVFSYSRGGVRFKIYSDTQYNTDVATFSTRNLIAKLMHYRPTWVCTGFLSTTSSPVVPGNDNMEMNTCNYVIEQAMTVGGAPSVEVEIPQYSPTHSRANIAYHSTVNLPYVTLTDMVNNIGLQVNSFAPTAPSRSGIGPDNFITARAGADDCNFAGFISIPPMVRAELI